MTGMFKMAMNKKNAARAFVDMRNNVGPIPIYLARSVVSPALHFERGSPPSGSQSPNLLL